MRVAIIGANGNFGLKRLRSILPSGDSIVALCDLDLRRALDIYNPEGLIQTSDYRSLRELPFEAAVIATPNYNKIPMVEYFLEAGKHVLVEKPFALSTTEVRRLFATARRNGVCLYVGYNLRFFPSLAKLLEMHSQGYFGNVYHLRMYYGHGAIHSLLRNGDNWKMNKDLNWGGAFVDMGVHLVSLAARFVSHIDSGRLLKRHIFSPVLEDHCVGLLDCQGCLVEFAGSCVTWRNRFSLELYGSEGFAELEGLVKYVKYGHQGERLRFGRPNPNGAPEVAEIFFTTPEAQHSCAVEVAPFSAEVEYLDQEWAWLSRSIAEGMFDLDREEAIHLFVAEVFERFYHESENHP